MPSPIVVASARRRCCAITSGRSSVSLRSPTDVRSAGPRPEVGRLAAVTWLWQAVVLFAVTNIDDIVVLSVFFGRAAHVDGSTRRIVVGQYLGFVMILAASLAGAFGAGQLSDRTVAY